MPRAIHRGLRFNCAPLIPSTAPHNSFREARTVVAGGNRNSPVQKQHKRTSGPEA